MREGTSSQLASVQGTSCKDLTNEHGPSVEGAQSQSLWRRSCEMSPRRSLPNFGRRDFGGGGLALASHDLTSLRCSPPCRNSAVVDARQPLQTRLRRRVRCCCSRSRGFAFTEDRGADKPAYSSNWRRIQPTSLTIRGAKWLERRAKRRGCRTERGTSRR